MPSSKRRQFPTIFAEVYTNSPRIAWIVTLPGPVTRPAGGRGGPGGGGPGGGGPSIAHANGAPTLIERERC